MKTVHPELLSTLADVRAFPTTTPHDPPVILELERGLGCLVREALPKAPEASGESALQIEYLHAAPHDDRYVSTSERMWRRRALTNGA